MSAVKAVLEHAKKHIRYPATKKQLMEACNNFSDVPKAEKDWFEKTLPERTYKNAEEVVKALLDKI
jgi:hypothetical protein